MISDLLLAVGAFAGFLVYAGISVATWKLGAARDPDPWDCAAMIVAAWAIYGGAIAAIAVFTRPPPHHDSVLLGVWCFLGWILSGLATGAAGIGYSDGTEQVFNVPKAVAWPLVIPVRWLLRLSFAAVGFVARGPERWGSWLADVVSNRRLSGEAKRRELAKREQRIATKERELGIGS